MTGEAFAVVRRGQQLIDVAVEGMGACIGGDSLEIGRIGRQAGEHLCSPPDQLPAAGLGGGGEARCLQPGEHELVDVAAAPCGGGNLGRRRGLGRLPAPVGGLAGGKVEAASGGLAAVVRPWQAPANPCFERGDCLVG